MKERRGLTDEERLEKYFEELRRWMPPPPADWAVNAKPCRWAKILEEKKDNPDATG
jgi:hypothetical protein